jgi:hypothetical protein
MTAAPSSSPRPSRSRASTCSPAGSSGWKSIGSRRCSTSFNAAYGQDLRARCAPSSVENKVDTQDGRGQRRRRPPRPRRRLPKPKAQGRVMAAPARLRLAAEDCWQSQCWSLAFAQQPPRSAGAGLPRSRSRPMRRKRPSYAWSRQRCEEWHIPDAPLRAFRDNERRGRGLRQQLPQPTADRRRTSTAVTHLLLGILRVQEQRRSRVSSATRAGSRRLGRGNGRDVFALVHDEYHADKHAGACQFQGRDELLVQCRDRGAIARWRAAASRPTSSPPTLVAAPGFRQDVDQGRHRGFFNPSNIIEHDGAWYALIATTGGEGQKRGVCLFRSDQDRRPDLLARLSTGKDFVHARPSIPIATTTDQARAVPAAQASADHGRLDHPPRAERDNSSRIFHLGPDPSQGIAGGRVAYSWSVGPDPNWSPLQTLDRPSDDVEQELQPTGTRYAYGSLADPSSKSRNFETTGDEAYPVHDQDAGRRTAGSGQTAISSGSRFSSSRRGIVLNLGSSLG